MAKGDNLKIRIDGDDSGLEKTLSGIGKTAKKGLGVAVKGISAAAVGITTLTALSTKAYAEFEQFVGGVDTLFEDSSEKVKKNAADAYKTAGMSANEYMKTVTSFSASLKQSFEDTAEGVSKAADVADMAITDMADNANKMGTPMEAIQDAYKGFAKQNYTMLDNLKLGYGGTKTEMERLLADAQKISGVKYDISNLADVYNAVHIIQTELGITGTTATEAATTIEGSASMMKASWSNLLVGFADDNAKLDELLNNFTESVLTFGGNILPRIQTTLLGIGDFAVQAAETIIPQFVDVIIQTLPQLIDAALQLLESFGAGLMSNIDVIIDAAIEIVMMLANAIITNTPKLLSAALQIILKLAEGISSVLPELIPTAINAILTIVEGLIENLDKIIVAAVDIIVALAEGLIDALPLLIEKVPVIISKLLLALADPEVQTKLQESGVKLLYAIADGIVKSIPAILEIGVQIVEGLWLGITNSWDWLVSKIKEWCGNILDVIKEVFGIHSPADETEEDGEMLTAGLVKGIKGSKGKALKVLEDLCEDILETVDKSNDSLLESERTYQQEAKRLDEDYERQQLELKLKNAKTAQAKQKIIENARLSDLKEANKLYLDSLKEAAEEERKLIEQQKKGIVDSLKEQTEEAIESIEEIAEAQDRLSEKLQSNGNRTFQNVRITSKDGVTEFSKLADVGASNRQLEKYNRLLDQLYEKREDLPDIFSQELANMEVEDAISYLSTLLNASDEEFNKYMADLDRNQELADKIGKKVLAPEAQKIKEMLEEHFGKEVPETFFDIGEDSATKYGEGFMQQLKIVLDQARETVALHLNEIGAKFAFAGAGNISTSNYTDSRVTNIYASSSDPHAIVETQRQNEIFQQHTSALGG